MSIEKTILENFKKTNNPQAAQDLLDLCIDSKDTKWLLPLSDCIANQIVDSDDPVRLYQIHRRVCFEGAKKYFQLFLLAVEWERDDEKKFYPPREKQLRPIVDALQELADNKLDLLAISTPPGVGKTTLAIFYLCWLAGKIPNEPMLTGSHSNSFIRGVYEECLRVLDPNG